VEIKVTTNPKTKSRKEVAAEFGKSVDFVDTAVRNDELDYAILSGSNKPIVINSKYKLLWAMYGKIKGKMIDINKP
jgi:hypothetical protein